MFELENITKTILSEIAMPKLKQSDIAKTYALAITSDEKIDWSEINQAIITRWSRSGLNRVKQMAWHIIAPAQQSVHTDAEEVAASTGSLQALAVIKSQIEVTPPQRG